MAFAENLLNARKRKGLSQEKLAEMLHVSRQAVSKWETGESTPDMDNLIRLREALGISLDALLLEAPEEPATEDKEPASTPVAPAQPGNARHAKRIWGAALLALGMLGVLVIWILSTMLPTAVPVQAAGSAPNTWEAWDEIVYEFGPFVRARRLQALLAALGACALAGGGLLIASARRNAPKG